MLSTSRLHTAARKIAATLAAGAIALGAITATSIPARANTDDIARLLAGIATLALLDQSRRNMQPAAGPVHHLQAKPQPQQPGWGHVPHRPAPPHVPQHARTPTAGLPGVCAIRIEGTRDAFYPARCLRDQGIRAELPNRCARQMRSPRGVRTVYSGACLREAGWDQRHRPAPHPYRPQWRGHDAPSR